MSSTVDVISAKGYLLYHVIGELSLSGKSNLSVSHVSPEFMKSGQLILALKESRVVMLQKATEVIDGKECPIRRFFMHGKWVDAAKKLPNANKIIVVDQDGYRKLLTVTGFLVPKKKDPLTQIAAAPAPSAAAAAPATAPSS